MAVAASVLTTPGRPVDVRDPLEHVEVMAAFDADEKQQDKPATDWAGAGVGWLLHDWRCHRPSPKCTSTQELLMCR